ncbi:MAG: hypothetical protein DWQ02_10905 [Bacteroidetes bacterium]|nr:MAG: hypothetical protein DWQ02_10905 [Bacteroidota bacterium]
MKLVHYQKYGLGHFYTVIFEKDSITGVGQDDYVEFGYSTKDAPDKEFIELVKRSKVKVNPWIFEYIKEHADSADFCR